MVSQRGRFAIAAAVATLSFGGSVQAQAVYWDIDGPTAGAGGATPSGTWDNGEPQDAQPIPVPQTPTLNWNDQADGTGAAIKYPAISDPGGPFVPDVIFAAGTNATGNYTVTLKAFNTIAANTLTIQEGNITVTQGTSASVSFAGGTGQVTLEPNTSLTLANQAAFTGFSVGVSGITMKNGSRYSLTNTGAGSTFFGSSGAGACPMTIDTDASVTLDFNGSGATGAGSTIQWQNMLSGGGTTTVTKTGLGDFRTGVSGHTFTKLVVTGGMYRTQGNAVPTLDENVTFTPGGPGVYGGIPASFMADNITLSNNGAIGCANNITLHNNRGIVLGAGGGRLDTQGGVVRIDGAVSGPGGLTLDRTRGDLDTGAPTHVLAGTNTYGGATTLKRGSLTIRNGNAIPDTSAVVFTPGPNLPANSLTFNVFNSETVGSLAGGNDTFGNVSILSTLTLTVGADNTNTTFSGRLTGAGNVAKIGTGTQTLAGGAASTLGGTTTVDAGRIQSTKPVNLSGYNAPGKIVVNPGAAIGVTVGASPNWTAADIDTLRANATFNSTPSASAQLAIDTSSAGGTFTYASSMAGGHGLTKLGTGTLDLTGSNSYTGSTIVEGGTLLVNKMHQGSAVDIKTGTTLQVRHSAPAGADPQSGDNAFVSQPSALTIAGTGKLDITNNDVVLDYSGASPIAAYEALVASAYVVGVGDWSGNGITSSTAAADGNYVVAIADNAALAAPFGTVNGGPLFAGVDVDIDTILIKFTHRADVDLDGSITPNDAAIFGGNYSENDPAVWSTGDMDYDGVFTPNDAAIFGGFYDESLSSLPEPGSLTVLALMGLGLARRRRRA